MVRFPSRRPFLLFAGLLVLANAAAWLLVRHELFVLRAETVRVAATVPAGDADGADRLTILLDRAVGPAGDATGGNAGPDPARLFTIEPPLPGSFRFAGPDRVEYVLADPLPPGRTWRVSPTPEFRALTGRRLEADGGIVFRTRALTLDHAAVLVADDERIGVRLTFNQPVVPAEVAERLSIGDGGPERPLRYLPETRDPGATVVFSGPRPSGKRLRLSLDGRLAGRDGDRPLGRSVTRDLDVPATFGLLGTDFEYFGSDERARFGIVSLRFSAPLDRTAPAPAIGIDPPVAEAATRHGDRSELLVDATFRPGSRYTLSAPAGTLAADGRVLSAPQSVVLDIPERDPEVRIPFDRGVLSPKGNLTLAVQVVNSPALDVEVFRVHEGNLLPWISGLRRDAAGRELVQRRFDVDLPRNEPGEVALDLGRLLSDPLGLYLVEVRSSADRWERDRAIVAVTDLAITVKRGGRGLFAFVTSVSTGRPVPGAVVSVFSRNNQVLATAETGEEGVAEIRLPRKHPDGPPCAVTAALGLDLTFLELSRRPLLLDDVDLSGRTAPLTYDAFVYPEREVYRPGDTIHLTGILRTREGEVPEPFPLAVTPVRPDGRELPAIPVTPGPQGFFHVDFATEEDSRTGPFEFRVALPGATVPVGRATALVEAFLPARIELSATPTKARFGPAEEPRIAVTARYLFGAPAAGLPAKVAWRYRPEAFRSAARPDHRFDAVFALPDDAGVGELEAPPLDGEGRIDVGLPAPEGARFALRATVTVTEPGSRSVSKQVAAVVDPLPRHVGLRPPPEGFVVAGRPFALGFAARTPEDEPAEAGPLALTLLEVRHEWVLRETDGRCVFETLERTSVVEERGDAGRGEAGEIEIVLPAPGRYRALVRDPETKEVTAVDLVAAENEAAGRAARPESPERVEVVLDRPEYEPGDEARVLVRSPFPGTLLLTLETDEVLAFRVVTLKTGEATVPMPLPPSLRGGAFLFASVVRPVDPRATEWLPHRAAGIVRVRTALGGHRLDVELSAPAEAAPGGPVAVEVGLPPAPEGAAPAVVHLFAVDEGILLSTDAKTPSPLDHFLAPRRLEVETGDLFADLLPDRPSAEGTARIGGDGGEAAEARRRSPVPMKRREAAVVWRESVVAGADGRVVATLPMPDLRGALRIMAVAACGDRYGRAERRIVLSTPLVLEAGGPRFLAPGDRARVPLKVLNLTDADRKVAFEVALDGSLSLAEAPGTVVVPAGGGATEWIDLVAGAEGAARAELTARTIDAGPPLSSAARIELAVRPAGPLHCVTELFRLRAGEELALASPDGFAPGARRVVSVSAGPAAELRPAFDALLDYPYGCVEQTTSRLVAILAAPALLPADPEGGGRPALAREMVEAGIRRLSTLQTPSGGLAYWPGGDRPHRFGTAYAALLLADARRAGYEVPDPLLDGMLRWLAADLETTGDDRPDPAERALVARVLSEAGRPPAGWMARLAEDLADLDAESRAHLAAAFAAAGRRDRALAAIDGVLPDIAVPAATSGRLTSSVRQQGVLLSVLLDVDPESPRVPLLAQRILDARGHGRWRSTIEDASALSALSRYALDRERAGDGPDDFSVTVEAGGKVFTGSSASLLRVALPAGDGRGRIAVRGTGAAIVAVRTEGLAAGDRAPEQDRGIRVRRAWTDPRGRAVDPAGLRVGDLVAVEVTIDAPGLGDGDRIDNVAVVDALPAGLEVENPRLATSAALPAIARLAPAVRDGAPDRVEFLDDRVLLFTSVDRERRSFRYLLRVVGRGGFVLPPVQASCMYAPEYASVSGGGRVEVER